MSSPGRTQSSRCSREQVREAAVWMTLLRTPDRAEKIERGLKRWLAADPSHAAAFETVSTAWEAAGALPRGPFPRLTRWQRAGFRQGFRHAVAGVSAAAIIVVCGILIYGRHAGISTSIGEQRNLTLQDGTRVSLNTGTRLVVNYDKNRRAVELKTGEAYFDVAKKGADWPFVVTVDDKQVYAVGTAFVVRRDDKRMSVTLLEGKVNVSPSLTGETPVIPLSPGQRLTLTEGQSPKMDEPAVEKIIAWSSGYVDLNVMPLSEAVMEMNRYSRVKIVIANTEAQGIPVSGIFRAGDIDSFVNAVADAYDLEAARSGDQIILRRR